MLISNTAKLMSKNTKYKLDIAGYTEAIILLKHPNGTIYCTKSGDLSTMDRDGANKTLVYNFATNGYVGHNVNGAILLPSGTMIVALTAYNDTMTFLRSTNLDYTAWELINNDWNGQRLYHDWDVSPDGTLLVGEYPTHANILTVRLWKVTNDGRTWEVIHTFNGRQGTLTEQKQIFHIHTVGYDKYTGLFWIGTGDNGLEPSVWTWDGSVMTLIGEGNQDWRQCSFVFTEDYVLWGADGGTILDGKNYIYMIRLDRKTNKLERLLNAEVTMFNCEIIGGMELPLFIGCGTPNTILLSNDGKNWYKVLNLQLNPAQPTVYSWFYNYTDNGDGRIFGYITGILREDNGQPLTHGTVILDVTR